MGLNSPNSLNATEEANAMWRNMLDFHERNQVPSWPDLDEVPWLQAGRLQHKPGTLGGSESKYFHGEG